MPAKLLPALGRHEARAVNGKVSMPQTLSVRRPGAREERVVVSAPLVAGGSRADGLLLPGTPAAALRLLPRPSGVVLEATSAGVRAGGRPVPAGTRRLVRPGERAEIQGSSLEVERERTDGGATRVAAGAILLDAAAGAIPAPGVHLLVLTGPAAGDRHPLSDGLTVGRGRSAGLRIHDPGASRVHARLRLGPGGATVEDLRSKNGLRVNGVRVERRPCPIRPGDEITVGETVLVLEDPEGRGRTRSAPAPSAGRGLPAPWVAFLLLGISAIALALAGS